MTQHVLSEEQYRDRRFQVQIDEAALAEARAEMERIRVEIDRRTVRAPVAGRVLQINVRPGEFAESGVLATPLMVVGDDARLRVRVDIDENDAGRVDPSAPAIAVVRGRPDLRTDLRFESIEPYVAPKKSLTGDTTERVDSRVLQVIYSFERAKLPVYVGQRLDVFIQAPRGRVTSLSGADPMLRIALKMLAGDRGKYAGLLFGIAFTSFLITFAASFFCGFMTRGFSLISDIPAADVWVMDPAVESVEQTTNMPSSALDRVRSVDGVRSAVPLALATAEVRFPNGRFQSFQLIGVDDATFVGVPLRNEIRAGEPAASPRRRADRLRWVRREARDTAIGARSVATRCTPPCSADPTTRRWRRVAGK